MSNARYKTHTGKEFNMSAFAEKNGSARAVGNSSMNARGDIIDAKGNVKIPSQSISRALSDIKNTEIKTVGLKADENISPAQSNTVRADNTPKVVASRDINTIDGPATEVEYSDGSMQIIPKTPTNPTSL